MVTTVSLNFRRLLESQTPEKDRVAILIAWLSKHSKLLFYYDNENDLTLFTTS